MQSLWEGFKKVLDGAGASPAPAQPLDLTHQEIVVCTHLSELVYRSAEMSGDALERAKHDLDERFPVAKRELQSYSVQKAGPQRYIMGESATTLYVAFQGTKHMHDWAANLRVRHAPLPWGPLNSSSGGRSASPRRGTAAAHLGFMLRSQAFPVEQLQEAAAASGKRLVLCGHSLGGAVAALTTLRLLQQLSSRPASPPTSPLSSSSSGDSGELLLPVRCICFATPAFANEVLAEEVEERGWDRYICNLVMPEDPVVPFVNQFLKATSRRSSKTGSSTSTSTSTSRRTSSSSSTSRRTSTSSSIPTSSWTGAARRSSSAASSSSPPPSVASWPCLDLASSDCDETDAASSDMGLPSPTGSSVSTASGSINFGCSVGTPVSVLSAWDSWRRDQQARQQQQLKTAAVGGGGMHHSDSASSLYLEQHLDLAAAKLGKGVLGDSSGSEGGGDVDAATECGVASSSSAALDGGAAAWAGGGGAGVVAAMGFDDLDWGLSGSNSGSGVSDYEGDGDDVSSNSAEWQLGLGIDIGMGGLPPPALLLPPNQLAAASAAGKAAAAGGGGNARRPRPPRPGSPLGQQLQRVLRLLPLAPALLLSSLQRARLLPLAAAAQLGAGSALLRGLPTPQLLAVLLRVPSAAAAAALAQTIGSLAVPRNYPIGRQLVLSVRGVEPADLPMAHYPRAPASLGLSGLRGPFPAHRMIAYRNRVLQLLHSGHLPLPHAGVGGAGGLPALVCV